ncbi:MAG: hypothetical protein FD150_439 [Rhodobacteraceae bacterium]|nr:MAG: hypothetical protein FD150_439 [Paracoccaceae bacterium]
MGENDIQAHNLNSYRELGLFGLKALLTLNGGAIIVLLAFLGNILGNEKFNELISMPLIEASIVAFLLGLLFCFVSAAMNMLLALNYAAEKEDDPFNDVSVLLFWLVVPALASFSFFAVGVLVALQAVS